LCTKIGYPIDATSAASLAKSLSQYFGYSPKQMTIAAVITQLIMRSMQLAVYFCTGTIEDSAEYRHYALSVPLYDTLHSFHIYSLQLYTFYITNPAISRYYRSSSIGCITWYVYCKSEKFLPQKISFIL
jgi:hypothetical protein